MPVQLQKIGNLILDIIFPKFCVNCGKLNCFICGNCFEQIEFFIFPLNINLKQAYLDQLYACFKYQEAAAKLIKVMKYQSVQNIGPFLGKLIYECMDIPTADLITAVPVHKRRLRERGFNQAELIAQKLAELTNTPYIDLLIKLKHSHRQASLRSKQSRLNNLVDTFAINSEIVANLYQNKSVLIVDDVTTTGATLNECAKILKTAGVKNVIGLAVAHEK